MTQLALTLACLFVAYIIYHEFLAQPKPITVKVAGNGVQLGQLAEGIVTALTESIEMRRGPVLGSVGDDGRTVTLHTQVEAVDGPCLMLRDRLVPGSWVTVVAGG